MLSMEKIRLENNSVQIIEIEINAHGDSIAVSPDDSALFDRFVAGYKKIAELADETPKKLDEIKAKYTSEDFSDTLAKTEELSRVNVQFSDDATAVVDTIFGEGTIRKYYRDVYEKIPTFKPGADCFLDFFQKITPHMETIFSRKVEQQNSMNKEHMEKYRPYEPKA
jgi:hypothetical protein